MQKRFEQNVIKNSEIRFRFRFKVNQYKNVLIKERVATHKKDLRFIKIEVDCNETFTESDVFVKAIQTNVENKLFVNDFIINNINNIDNVNEFINEFVDVNNFSLAKILNNTCFTRICLIFMRISTTKSLNV